MPKTFKINHTYSTRGTCDHEQITSITIAKRTNCFVTTTDGKRLKATTDCEGNESVMPEGRYSMAPCVRAINGEPAQQPQPQKGNHTMMSLKQSQAYKTILDELQTEASNAPFSKVTTVTEGNPDDVNQNCEGVIVMTYSSALGLQVTTITFWADNDIAMESNKSGVGTRHNLTVEDVQFFLRQSA